MRNFWALPAFLRLAIASQHAFSVENDLLAFPQYQILYSETFISLAAAESLIESSRNHPSDQAAESEQGNHAHDGSAHDLAKHTQAKGTPSTDKPTTPDATYERIQISSTPYLCAIPTVEPPELENTTAEATPEEKQQELMRASAHGWELLKGMQGNCLYYSGGWWVYSFCYNQAIKQFHPLPPGQHGVPIFPPVENSEVQSYVLGRFDADSATRDKKSSAAAEEEGEEGGGEEEQGREEEEEEASAGKTPAGSEEETAPAADGDGNSEHKDLSLPHSSAHDPAQPQNEHQQLQMHNSQRFLVRHLTDGTICDVTGRPRRISVQFHCDPNGPDEIRMIKETASCVYLMVIHTPRLCNDVAFLPPQVDRPNSVVCREIVGPSDEAAWKARKAGEAEAMLRYGGRSAGSKAGRGEAAAAGDGQGLDAAALEQLQQRLEQEAKGQTAEPQAPLVIGGVEVGGQKLVGGEPSRTIKASNIVIKMGQQAQKGKVVATLAQSDGKSVTMMTERELKERGIDKSISKEMTEDWVKKMEKMAGERGIPWDIKILRTAEGLEIEAVWRPEDALDSNSADGKPPKAKKKPTGSNEEAGKGSKQQKKQKKEKYEQDEPAGSEEEL